MKIRVKYAVANNLKAYREAAGLSCETLAAKSYVPAEAIASIEHRNAVTNEWYYLMKIAETLGIAYYELFETENGETTARNVYVPLEAINKIVDTAKKQGLSKLQFALDIGTTANTLWTWSAGNATPSPLAFSNALGRLGLRSDDFKYLVEKPVEKAKETVEAKAEQPESDVMAEVIKACNVYKNVDTLKAELKDIIDKANGILKMLEGV